MSERRVAIITGATSGIGLAVAKRLGKDGFQIVLNGRNNEAGTKRVEELNSEGIAAEYCGFDVTDEAAVTENVKNIGEKYGKIDALVNNAGGLGGRSRFEETAIPYLKKGDCPSIINFTSNAGWNAGGPGAGMYGTSKAGVHTLTRALAKDLAEYGIRVNAVSPGTIDTDFHIGIKSTKPEIFASWANNIMLKRLGQPEDVSGVVSFLASKDASFITAETIQIGGGQALGI